MSQNLVSNASHGRIAIGSLLWACAAAPAFAAGFDIVALDTSFPLHDALLYGSLGLLAIALVLRFSKRTTNANATPDTPDLRWWKQHDQDYMRA